jgi:hypothetical protein
LALIRHRYLRNPVHPIARGKFLSPLPESVSCPTEREAWPQNLESPFTNCRSSRPPSSRNIAFTSRSIRGSGLLRVCSKRSGAKNRDLPIGSYINEDGKRRKLGSRISQAAGKAGGNFLTPEIAHIARRETAYREIGALIDAEWLTTNLLSSMPLTFNLLAPWGHSLERASGI